MKAYVYTSVLSIMLLDAWTIPVCMILSIFLLRVGYHWSQSLGTMICVSGIAILLAGDLMVRQTFDGKFYICIRGGNVCKA